MRPRQLTLCLLSLGMHSRPSAIIPLAMYGQYADMWLRRDTLLPDIVWSAHLHYLYRREAFELEAVFPIVASRLYGGSLTLQESLQGLHLFTPVALTGQDLSIRPQWLDRQLGKSQLRRQLMYRSQQPWP